MNCEFITKSFPSTGTPNLQDWYNPVNPYKSKKSPYLNLDVPVGFKINNPDNFHISLPDESSIALPKRLGAVKDAIDSSRYILDLLESWDDEGASAISQNTWIISIKFLSKYINWIFVNKGIIIQTPDINPCKDGTIDIVWRTATARMLLNVNESEEGLVKYYGDHFNNVNSIKGLVKANSLQEFLASWMVCLS